jgi:SAM-dependent methyltransferase
MKNIVSRIDKLHHKIIRKNVTSILKRISYQYKKKKLYILDIGPQDYLKNQAIFKNFNYKSLDIDKKSKSDFKADITVNNKRIIKSDTFDIILCTEVLEHTLNPFKAVKEIYRILKNKGKLHVTTPLNFRIHGPLPDCWRFTEHGLKYLFKDFKILKMKSFNSDRFLFPIQYYLVLQKCQNNSLIR